MAVFCQIIVLSSVFCLLAVPSLLKQPCFADSSCNDFLSHAHHCLVMLYKLI